MSQPLFINFVKLLDNSIYDSLKADHEDSMSIPNEIKLRTSCRI